MSLTSIRRFAGRFGRASLAEGQGARAWTDFHARTVLQTERLEPLMAAAEVEWS